MIWAVGLLVVLIAGGIDISFAVAASVVQYLCVYALPPSGEATGFSASCSPALFGIAIGCVNASLIYFFHIISIVVTIATFNALFGLSDVHDVGHLITDLPDWWTTPIALFQLQSADGAWADLGLAGRGDGRGDGGDLASDFAHHDRTANSTPSATIRRGRGGRASTIRADAVPRLRLDGPDGRRRRA